MPNTPDKPSPVAPPRADEPQPAPGVKTFDLAHAFTSWAEGGWTVDTGGPTKYGVSLRWLRAQGLAVGDIDRDGDIDADDIRALTPAQARDLFRHFFWSAPRLDELPPLVAIAHYDFSVNAGPIQAGRALQEAVNLYPGPLLKVDGVVGPATRARVREVVTSGLADLVVACRMLVRRMEFYARLKDKPRVIDGQTAYPWRDYYGGWCNRTEYLRRYLHRCAQVAYGLNVSLDL